MSPQQNKTWTYIYTAANSPSPQFLILFRSPSNPNHNPNPNPWGRGFGGRWTLTPTTIFSRGAPLSSRRLPLSSGSKNGTSLPLSLPSLSYHSLSEVVVLVSEKIELNIIKGVEVFLFIYLFFMFSFLIFWGC